jgi:hypothetical protein
MPAKITRVELAIVVAALLVLVFSNQPPEPGKAEIRQEPEAMAADTQNQAPQTQFDVPMEDLAPAATADNLAVEPISPPQPKRKRIAMVDARNCNALRYPEVMYGEVTVRPVWNGTKFEWKKVCEVREKDGATSVWSFDEAHQGVTVTEMP